MLKDLFLSVTNPFAASRSLSKSLLVLPYNDVTEDTDKKLKRCNSLEKSSPFLTRPRGCHRRASGSVQRTKSNTLPSPQRLHSPTHRKSTGTTSPQSNRKSSGTTSPNPQTQPTNILVVGARNVGKSALLVRFMTKRYIGEYISGKRQTYNYSCDVGDDSLPIVFQDENSHHNGERMMKSQLSDENLAWADGIIMVYDVGDERSFDYAIQGIRLLVNRHDNVKEVNHNGSSHYKPVLLLGNKTDIITRRCVSEEDVIVATKDFPSWVFCGQVSAAEEYEEVANYMNKLITRIREHRVALLSFSAKLSRTLHMGNVFKHKQRPRSENIGDSHFYC